MEALAALAALIAAAFFLQPKPEPDRIILLPGSDGTAGKVIVESTSGTLLLDKPYAAVEVDTHGKVEGYQDTAAAITARYTTLMAAQPARPQSYTLYFQPASNELTPESIEQLEALKRDALNRPAPEIRVIGHTDRAGSDADNDTLSQKRAESIVETLRGVGVNAQSFEAVGRGEREPLVPTEDGLAEAKNRRVEVSIR